MESEKNMSISEETKAMFRNAAVWMRVYAVLLIILIALCVILLLIFSADRDGKIISSMLQNQTNEVVTAFKEIFGLILVGILIFVLIFGYAATRLLSAANSFTAISYNPTKDQIVKAFKNLRLFWMYYGITMIILALMTVYLVVRIIAMVG